LHVFYDLYRLSLYGISLIRPGCGYLPYNDKLQLKPFILDAGLKPVESLKKKPSHPPTGQLGFINHGNPAVSVKPVAFRPYLTAGLALTCVFKNY